LLLLWSLAVKKKLLLQLHLLLKLLLLRLHLLLPHLPKHLLLLPHLLPKARRSNFFCFDQKPPSGGFFLS
jgi:hypothetical protein